MNSELKSFTSLKCNLEISSFGSSNKYSNLIVLLHPSFYLFWLESQWNEHNWNQNELLLVKLVMYIQRRWSSLYCSIVISGFTEWKFLQFTSFPLPLLNISISRKLKQNHYTFYWQKRVDETGLFFFISSHSLAEDEEVKFSFFCWQRIWLKIEKLAASRISWIFSWSFNFQVT